MKDDPIASRKLTVTLLSQNSPMVQTCRKFEIPGLCCQYKSCFWSMNKVPSVVIVQSTEKNPTFFWAGKESMHSSNNIFMEAKQFFLMPHKTFQAAIHSTFLLPLTLHDKQGVQLVCKCTAEVPWRAFAKKKTVHSTIRNLISWQSESILKDLTSSSMV